MGDDRAMTDSRERSRLAILHFVLSFSVANRSRGEDKSCWATEPFFSRDLSQDPEPPIGTIVIPTAAPPSKYCIGWLRDIRYRHGTEYLIESLEDGATCWWGNIGIKFMALEEVLKHPSWQWTDRQWKFVDTWERICFKEKDADWHRPFQPKFGPGYRVTIGLRTKFSEDNRLAERTFEDWRKVTREQMRSCYDDCLAEKEAPELDRLRLEREDEALAAAGAK